MDYQNGCLICGHELEYQNENSLLKCSICSNEYSSNAKCVNGHFVCDACHQKNGMDLIESFCNNTTLSDPMEMAIQLMSQNGIFMHGPEHHYLTAAVMITAYYKAVNDEEKIRGALTKARRRAEQIPGGFCGTHGSCGAGMSAGIFVSVVTNATPYSKLEWSHVNKMTATCLNRIAESNGPRCCKRTTFQSIKEAIGFAKEYLKVEIPVFDFKGCIFYKRNKECLHQKCEFFSKEISTHNLDGNCETQCCC